MMTSNGYRPLPTPGPDCASFADLLPLLGEDILDDKTHKRLRQHVATCAYCQMQVAIDTRVASVFRHYFEPPAPRLFSPEELMKITDYQKRPASVGQPVPSSITPLRQRPTLPGRIKTITAVAAIAAVVVLFVVLFQGFGLGHSHSQTGASTRATATQTPTATPTPQPDESYRMPIIAPSNPQIVYRLAPISASSQQLILQRSTDGGTSWHSHGRCAAPRTAPPASRPDPCTQRQSDPGLATGRPAAR
jgi:hypothetical protein